jgi:tryptophan synthase alpha chain
MNRINTLFRTKQNNILSVYFTAGHPNVDSAPVIIKALADSGVDMVEIGMPFSDPIADGPVIQGSSSIALKNGMSLKLLFHQLHNIRKEVEIPLLLMGYLNPVLQYGMENFCRDCAAVGIDGVILPDLPLEVFDNNSFETGSKPGSYNNLKELFSAHNLHNIFLISPHTAEDRIRKIDAGSGGFVYMVASSSTTGIKGAFRQDQLDYFQRIKDMKLKNPALAGFGISNHKNFETVCRYAHGAIIGSAFVNMLSGSKDIGGDISNFVSNIKKGK